MIAGLAQAPRVRCTRCQAETSEGLRRTRVESLSRFRARKVLPCASRVLEKVASFDPQGMRRTEVSQL